MRFGAISFDRIAQIRMFPEWTSNEPWRLHPSMVPATSTGRSEVLPASGRYCTIGEFAKTIANLTTHKARIGGTRFPGPPPSRDRGPPGITASQGPWASRDHRLPGTVGLLGSRREPTHKARWASYDRGPPPRDRGPPGIAASQGPPPGITASQGPWASWERGLPARMDRPRARCPRSQETGGHNLSFVRNQDYQCIRRRSKSRHNGTPAR